MVVFRHAAPARHAQFQHHGIVHRGLNGLPHADVAKRRLAHVHPRHHGVGRGDLVAGGADGIQLVDEVFRGLLVQVHLAACPGVDFGGRVIAHVDEVDLVQMRFAAPPLAVAAADELCPLAHGMVHQFERPCADGVGCQVAGRLKAGMHAQRGVIGHVRDDGDVGRRQVQLHRHVIDPDDGAIARLAGGGVCQRAKARGHGIAIGVLVHPAGDVEDHVIGGKGITVVPGHAGAHAQGVLRGVGVHLPAFQQAAFEGEVLGVFHQRFQELPGGVGNLAPVGGARVFQVHHLNCHAQRAALDGGALRMGRCGQSQHGIGGGGRGAEGAGQRQEFAAADRVCGRLGRARQMVGKGFAGAGQELHRCLLAGGGGLCAFWGVRGCAGPRSLRAPCRARGAIRGFWGCSAGRAGPSAFSMQGGGSRPFSSRLPR